MLYLKQYIQINNNIQPKIMNNNNYHLKLRIHIGRNEIFVGLHFILS